jgi:hypothetical protein
MVLAPKIISDKFADDKKRTNYRRNYCQFIYGFNFIDWEQIQSFSVLLAIVFVLQTTSIVGTIDDKR